MSKNQSVVLFDGVCNLCNGAVTFLIRRDRHDRFRFAALQSEMGAELTRAYGIDTEEVDSIVLIEDKKAFVRSDAALRIARGMNGAYPLLYGFIILPRFLRDPIYNWIAKNRYKWFGRKDQCMIPTPELKAKFL
ncbi:thiol-disulfide oxidoreductase DCC family protein [Aureitalea marina]|uniref:Thiol-disulfide oxidoreductase n=1 Tax=Aureitalea marina TaxID=930804 RepID=A0A2S7KP25_9FLAO|nr:thiol-disulfide oxidoreductase DCC family protein [Aureitalea marina]PQB04376.1 thiol-disulfide oxidoreductase [Aureitalea marina]